MNHSRRCVDHSRRLRYRSGLLVLGLVLLGPLLAAGPSQAAGEFGAGFPKLDSSARGTGLGGNMTALASGSEALLWNPAGLLDLARRELTFTYSDLFGLGLVRQTVAQFGWPRLAKEVRWDRDRFRKVPLPPPARSAFGLAVSSLRADLGDGSYHETEIALAYAWRLPLDVLAGADYRYLTSGSGYATTGGSGHAVDLGMQRPLGPLRLGLSAANLVSVMNWDEESGTRSTEEDEPLPQRWSVGLAYASPHWPLLAALQGDWRGASFNRQQAGMALEWRPHTVLALRGAVRSREDALGSRTEWSAGMGLRIREYRFDYGWQESARDLGQTHRWSGALNL